MSDTDVSDRLVLGLSAGQLQGSAEILLKEALSAAAESGARVELVRLAELRLRLTGQTIPATPNGCGNVWCDAMASSSAPRS